jgi:hypothetical protein
MARHYPLLAFLVVACSPSIAEADRSQDKVVEQALALSRETSATYSLYAWNTIMLDDETVEEWSAEFHSGNLHRVETPRDRVVADCAAGIGIAVNLVTGERASGQQVAKAACGVNANMPILSSRHLGKVKTKFGLADKIEITDKNQIRGYSVLANGALVEATITERGPPKKLRLSYCPILVSGKLPEQDIFTSESLKRSVVPSNIQGSDGC